MKKIITIPCVEGTQKFTSLVKKSPTEWEWNPCRIGEETQLKDLNLPIFSVDELSKYIQLFEEIRHAKEEDPECQKLFLRYYKFVFWKSKIDGLFDIVIYVKNKYISSFKYGDESVLAKFQLDEWDDEYLGTLESFGGLSSASDLSEQDLQNYIDKLIAEYELATGKIYERA